MPDYLAAIFHFVVVSKGYMNSDATMHNEFMRSQVPQLPPDYERPFTYDCVEDCLVSGVIAYDDVVGSASELITMRHPVMHSIPDSVDSLMHEHLVRVRSEIHVHCPNDLGWSLDRLTPGTLIYPDELEYESDRCRTKWSKTRGRRIVS